MLTKVSYRNIKTEIESFFYHSIKYVDLYIELGGGKFVDFVSGTPAKVKIINQENYLLYAYFFSWLHWVENIMILRKGDFSSVNDIEFTSQGCCLCNISYRCKGKEDCYFLNINKSCNLDCNETNSLWGNFYYDFQEFQSLFYDYIFSYKLSKNKENELKSIKKRLERKALKMAKHIEKKTMDVFNLDGTYKKKED